MGFTDIYYFLFEIYDGLSSIGKQLLDFLQGQPFADFGVYWSWSSIMFGVSLFAFLGWAVVRWIIP